MVKGKAKGTVGKTKEVAEKPVIEEKLDAGFFVYLGPSIRGMVQNGSIYAGPRSEVEKLLADAIQKYPRIAHLIVSGETLSDDRIKVKTPGNYLYETYRRLIAELKQ